MRIKKYKVLSYEGFILNNMRNAGEFATLEAAEQFCLNYNSETRTVIIIPIYVLAELTEADFTYMLIKEIIDFERLNGFSPTKVYFHPTAYLMFRDRDTLTLHGLFGFINVKLEELTLSDQDRDKPTNRYFIASREST